METETGALKQQNLMWYQKFNIQEDMVEIAKKTTAQYSSVNICVGDVMAMPYEDNSFDVAISIYVTCNLPIETLTKHFEELHRVLVATSWKSIGKYIDLSDLFYQTLYLYDEDDEASVTVKKSVAKVLLIQKGFFISKSKQCF